VAENAIEKAYELGKEYEKTYRGCSQCVVAALQDTFNIRKDDIFKAPTISTVPRWWAKPPAGWES